MLEKIKNFILDLFFPKFCLGCNKNNTYICQKCQDKLELASTITRQKYQEKSALRQLTWTIPYSNLLVKKLIKSFKYRYIKELAKPLSKFLIKALKKNFQFSIFNFQYIVIPVPLHKYRARERGFNQAELLATEIANHFSFPLETEIIQRTKIVKPQTKMKNYAARKQNMKNAFELNPKFLKKCVAKNENLLKDKLIILIDDVATTGATLFEAAKVLKRAGTKEIWGLVVAKG